MDYYLYCATLKFAHTTALSLVYAAITYDGQFKQITLNLNV